MKPLDIARWVFVAALTACSLVFLVRFQPAREVLLRHGSAALAACVIALAMLAAGSALLTLLERAFGRVLPAGEAGSGESGEAAPRDDSHLTDDGQRSRAPQAPAGQSPADLHGWSRALPTNLAASLLVGGAVLGQLIAIPVWTHAAIEWTVPALVILLAARGTYLLVRGRPRQRTEADVTTLILLAVPILLALLQALSPVSSPDELVYKLSVPKNYLNFGGAVELPLNSHSYICLALQHVDLAALLMSGGSAAKLVHFLLYLCTLNVIFRFGSSFAGRWGGRAAALVFAFTPALALTAGWAWMEWSILGLLILSAQAWQSMRDRPDAAAAALLIASLSSAAAVKYTALPWIAVAAPLMAWRMRGRIPITRFAVTATALALISGGMFYLRNTLWTGSPFAPFLLEDAPAIANFRSDSGWLELIRGMDVFHPAIADDALGIVLPACVLLALAGLRLYPQLLDLFLIGAVQIAGLTALAPTSRLALTGFTPLALLGAITAARVVLESSARWRRVFIGAIAIALAAQSILAGWIYFPSYDVLPNIFGAESERDLLRRTRGYAGAYEWIEANTAPDSVVLLVGENRSYHVNRRNLAAGNLDGPRMAALLASAPDPTGLHRNLRARGVTHLVIHPEWLRAVESPRPLSLMEREYIVQVDPRAAGVFQAMLQRNARAVWRDARYRIYELNH